MQFSGVTPTTPVDVAKTTHGASNGWLTATAPSVTTTKNGDEIVVFFVSGARQSFTAAPAAPPQATA